MPNRVRVISIRDGDRPELERLAWEAAEAEHIADRARIVLLAAQGMSGREIAKRVGCSEPTVITWRRRYDDDGLDGLIDRARPGAPARVVTQAVRREIIDATLCRTPANPERPWSARSLSAYLHHAKGIDVSRDSVRRVWLSCGISPAPDGGFRLAVDPEPPPGPFRVMGVYLRPPHGALVLCRETSGAWDDEIRPLVVALRGGPRRAGSVIGPPIDLKEFLFRAAIRWPLRDLHVVYGLVPPTRTPRVVAQGPLPPRVRVHRSRNDATWPCQVGVCCTMGRRPPGARPQGESVTPQIDELRGAVATFVAAWPVHPVPFSWLRRR